MILKSITTEEGAANAPHEQIAKQPLRDVQSKARLAFTLRNDGSLETGSHCNLFYDGYSYQSGIVASTESKNKGLPGRTRGQRSTLTVHALTFLFKF